MSGEDKRKALVIGSNGFVGSHVAEALADSYEVHTADRGTEGGDRLHHIDLTRPETIKAVLEKVKPDIIVSCAGVIENTEKAQLNPKFTKNLLTEALASGLDFERIVVMGSAAEYGLVDEDDIPVSEDTPLNANSQYGLSKKAESKVAEEFHKEHNLPVVVTRIFNPIGEGMNSQQLLPNLLRQIQAIQDGTADTVEVSRLDTKRDYVDIDDVALAIKAVIENNPREVVYNVGSGKSTSTKELVELIVGDRDIMKKINMVETSSEPEPLVAVQADISRIGTDVGWEPKNSIEETIEKIRRER